MGSKAMLMTGLTVSTSIMATGLFLQQAGRGTFGSAVKNFADAVTEGFSNA
jgi:hypothetical protein